MGLLPDLPRANQPADASGEFPRRRDPELPAVAALAHDLRSPLSAVLGFARLAKEDLDAGDTARAALLVERIERSAGMLEAILASALEPRRACATAADLRGALEQVRAERKRDLERRAIRLLVPDDAPAFAVRPPDLYRVLGNLIGNAIEHMGATRDATISVSVCWEGDLATLRVSDNGTGIAPDRRERVFEVAHSRCNDATQCQRGFGLAIVRSLAASWGGSAWVDASHAPGASVCVTIPVAR